MTSLISVEYMSTLYKEIFKQNNNKIKELTGEYKINCEQLVKELRSYAIKTQSTEKVVEEMIDELCQGYNRNIRFTTLVVNKEEYLNNYKAKCYKGNDKPTFSTKEKIGIAIFIIIALLFTAVTIYLQQPVSFDVPENVEIKENILTFDEVEYAEKYIVYITDVNGKTVFEKEIKDPTLDLSIIPELKNIGTYKIRVKVKETRIMEESEWSEVVIYFNGDN